MKENEEVLGVKCVDAATLGTDYAMYMEKFRRKTVETGMQERIY